jgi:hypothetical protein
MLKVPGKVYPNTIAMILLLPLLMLWMLRVLSQLEGRFKI